MTADCNARMNREMAGILATSDDIVVAVAARNLVIRLMAEDPDLLQSWLAFNAEQFVASALGARVRNRRSYVRRTSLARSFSEAAEQAPATQNKSLSPFRVRHVVDDKATTREAGQMTGNDHLYVATTYEMESVTYKTLAAFHQAVARRVGDSRTCEVIDEETYARMYNSIVRG